MSTLIIGANGSMGTRYRAIFEWLEAPYWAVDKENGHDQIITRAKAADRIILCTPTETHGKFLRELMPLDKPILCEKPICKDMDELNDLLTYAKRKNSAFNMVTQYEELLSEKTRTSNEPSMYNYFRHGADGLVWDCLQIIAFSNDECSLLDDSPIWNCNINGQKLNLSDMDGAYVAHIRRWLAGHLHQDMNWLMEIHEEASELNGEMNEQYN